MSTSRGRRFVQRTTWPTEQLDVDRIEAIDHFRRQRLQEPLEAYLDNFEDARDILDDLIERTVDLTLLDEHALPILLNPNLLDGFRYLAGPPISLDDLKVLVDAGSLAPKALQSDPDLVRRLVATIRDGLDRRRFPWVYEDREPTETEREAAIIATATLIATRRTETGRRSEGKKEQEDRVRQALEGGGFVEVSIPSGLIGTLSDAPRPGSFSREVILGERKADLVVGLWDGRIMPIECKVSNSSINSVKRLNNDAAVKAVAWLQDFGDRHVVPVATLSGVFKLHNLEQAQARGLTIYWAHRLSDLIDWIERTRSRSLAVRDRKGQIGCRMARKAIKTASAVTNRPLTGRAGMVGWWQPRRAPRVGAFTWRPRGETRRPRRRRGSRPRADRADREELPRCA